MNDKKNQWLVAFVNNKSQQVHEFLRNKEEVEVYIRNIVHIDRVSPAVIRIYPPNSNMTATEFILHREKTIETNS